VPLSPRECRSSIVAKPLPRGQGVAQFVGHQSEKLLFELLSLLEGRDILNDDQRRWLRRGEVTVSPAGCQPSQQALVQRHGIHQHR
jgi:hypothetical protein